MWQCQYRYLFQCGARDVYSCYHYSPQHDNRRCLSNSPALTAWISPDILVVKCTCIQLSLQIYTRPEGNCEAYRGSTSKYLTIIFVLQENNKIRHTLFSWHWIPISATTWKKEKEILKLKEALNNSKTREPEQTDSEWKLVYSTRLDVNTCILIALLFYIPHK